MSKNRRTSQHRTQRDSNTKEKRDLIQENKVLKREVTRLRRHLEKFDDPPDTEEVQKERPELPTAKCPNCKSLQLSSITTPSGKTRFACRSCSWKGSLQQTSAIS